jgi:CRISPR system Cascade subunit CasC
MSVTRFLQIHTLHSYTAALLNRDESGLAKRLPYGGVLRTRVSSQCLKRHWRKADDDPHALGKILGGEDSFRSRELVTKLIFDPLRKGYPEAVLQALEPEFQKSVYGDKADKGKASRQTLLFGAPEIRWLKEQAEDLAKGATNAAEAKKAVDAWAKDFKANIKILRDNAALPGGLAAALFGRMVTSDTAANIDAPIHVAHAFTVHAAETESDYFTAVDDLKDEEDDSGADTIQETELTSGLFYGYVVIDLPGLISNCGGNRNLAASVVHNLVYLIAEVSPGAKLGSTAPYDRASFLLLEAGDRQPRSLAGAYRKPVNADLEQAVRALAEHLNRLDESYETSESRRYLTLSDASIDGSEKGTLSALAAWASDRAGEAQ